MIGIIKTFLEEKQYGFIQGNDHKDYFFHQSNVLNKHTHTICEGTQVSFEQKATPKGYSAIKITICTDTTDIYYTIPDTTYVSKSNSIKGWEIIELSNWIVQGTARSSPDDAKSIMLQRAKELSANCVLNMEYSKTTGSEPGTGKGTYYYTIHHFNGRLANIAKKSLSCNVTKDDLIHINKNAVKLKKTLIQQTNSAKEKRMIFWAILLIIVGVILISEKEASFFIIIPILVIGYKLSHVTNYDSWLQEIHL